MPWIAFIAIAALLLVAMFALLKTERGTDLILKQVGNALGLEISTRTSEVRLRGMPRIVVHDLIARMPGATTPVLTAKRMALSLPWSTLRARGKKLEFERIQINTPTLDMDALQAWLATRPEGDSRIPTLDKGLQIDAGVLLGDGWRVEALDIALPTLQPQHPVEITSSGVYENGDTSAPFDLQFALANPASDSTFEASGQVTLQRPDWQVPANLHASGTLQVEDDAWTITALELTAEARFEAGTTRLPFAFGLATPLRYADGRLTLQPLGIAVRVADTSDSPIPNLDAHGSLALHQQLALQLTGNLTTWPAAWPALPPPLDNAGQPLSFSLDYRGASDLSDVATLDLQRSTTDFHGRLRLPVISEWLDRNDQHSPLPPLDGHVSIARVEIAGATLEGVEISIDEDRIDANEAAPPAAPEQ